jgi:hypothetical protein
MILKKIKERWRSDYITALLEIIIAVIFVSAVICFIFNI